MERMRDSGFGYDYLPGVGQYSTAVVAGPGHTLTRVRLTRSVSHELAFELITAHLAGLGLPSGALCAIELRSPEPFSEQGFAEYNERYRHALRQLGIDLDQGNPVARSNLCPAHHPPADVAVHAFSYAAPVREVDPGGLAPLGRTFVVSGSAEVPEGEARYTDHIVARGDLGPDGLARKARWVVEEMTRRLRLIGADWSLVTGAQVYTVRDMGSILASEVQSTIGRAVTWHACAPPIMELEFEMDCRRIGNELVLDPAVS